MARVTLADVRRVVDQEWAVRPESRIAWPDPHPDRAPLTEEYSQVTDPERYRVVGARAATWASALVRLGLARSEPLAVPPDVVGVGVERVRLVPTVPVALPLEITTRSLEDVPGTVVDLALGAPPVDVGLEPDCGCDACDTGSADLLGAIDDDIVRLLGGDLIVVVGPRGRKIVASPDEWSAAGWTRGVDDAIRRARRGERVGDRTLVSASWWTV
ncbi:DUF6226 family protein [Microbacterium sp. M1A1_1b]